VFIGHFAAALAAKRVEARPSLGVYVLAAQLPDVLWPAFLLLGLEHVTIAPGDTAFTPLRFDSYPYSHSLLAMLLWGGAMGVMCATRAGRRAGVVVAALVLSHWLFDWLTHRPDMPLVPDGTRYGLGLWNSVPATLALELSLFAGALWLYARGRKVRPLRLAVFSAVLLLIYAGNAFGPPPPSVPALAWTALVGAPLFYFLAAWTDR
jgi:hypothetical protein